jgi:tetratricopeptide (TPR) repeat protein
MQVNRRIRVVALLVLMCYVMCAGTAAAGVDQASIIAHFQAALQATQAGNIEQAVKEYKAVLELDPTVIEARVNLGLAYHMLGQYDLAVGELAKALRERPNLVGPNIVLGIDYLKLGSPAKALAPLKEALTLEPSNREARRALAACYLAGDDYRNADAEFRKVFALDSDKEQAWFALGRDYLDMTKRLNLRMSRVYADSAWNYRLAGDALGERHLWNDAAREYRKALEIQPAQPGLHASLGDVLLQVPKAGEAEAEFRSELNVAPDSVEALLGLTEVNLAKGDAKGALENVSRILTISPQFLSLQQDFPSVEISPEAARQLALDLGKAPAQPSRSFLMWAVYRVADEPSKAEQERSSFDSQVGHSRASARQGQTAHRLCEAHDYAECADLLGSRQDLAPSDYLLLGKARLALGQREGAAEAFEAALVGEKQSPEPTYWLIRSYTALSDGCFKQLMAKFPDSWRTHQLKGEGDHLRQADREAIEEYQAAARLQPDAFEVHRALGEVYLSMKSLEDGRQELEKALSLNPSDAQSLYLLGGYYIAERQPQKAVPFLERALRFDPDLLEARASLGRAYLRSGQAALAVPQLEKAVALDRYGDLHYLLYQAYRDAGKQDLARTALAQSQAMRQQSAVDDQAKIKHSTDEE